MDVNFELYKVFYYVAKLNSFSEAADKLYISQSAVSQSIKALESKLGIKLFIRNTKNIRLTTEGEKLFAYVEQAVNLFSKGERLIDEMKELEEGEVRIGASDTICRHFLLPYIERYHTQYPNIKIHIISRTSPVCTQLLEKGEVDLAVVNINENYDYKSFNISILKEIEDIFVAGKRFNVLKGRKVTLEELSQYPLLILEKNTNTRASFDKLFQEQGMKVKPEIELSSIDLLIDMAKIGLGISYVVKDAAVSAISDGSLFTIDLKEKIKPRQLGLLIHKDIPLPRAAQELVNLVIASAFEQN
ncbi:LysR family transcriptional regulator [Lutispora thermophila]|uniref:DNA-binding transcriptional regulator, LysR family n=1 Tax=Lutispora thermophila DSM 19022 TaxID=1122184 RepID=A0A1M6AX66_9FIRM|nr:LysR family transcriptional regulator [Lutispora thermophila]SHI41084.1 DNA-binding transcriptional regulator, LysR family [Lutispora thermophila DSM 19022]